MTKTMLELFSGSAVMSNLFHNEGYNTLSIDNSYSGESKNLLKIDVLKIDKKELKRIKEILGNITVIWASPPCTSFSVANISGNFSDGKPISSKAFIGLAMVKKTLEIIHELNPEYWFIENPRGMLRKMDIMKPYHRKTVSYCQYGEKYQKPTDIWTNCSEWIPRPMCKPGDNCHESSPRGSSGGVQGLSNAYERGKLPLELCAEIFKVVEGQLPIIQKKLGDDQNGINHEGRNQSLWKSRGNLSGLE